MSIRIKDVAEVAGVSVATVSRVLGSGPVSADLRDRVEAAVRSTGYRPNLSARRLRSQHSRTIGLIVSDIRNPFFTTLSRAVEDAAYRAEMRVVLCNTDENPDREAMYLRLMQEERVTGLVYAPTRIGSARLADMTFDFPVVMVDRSGPAGTYDEVLIDNSAAIDALIGDLHARGCRRIGGLFGRTSFTAEERRRGYVAAMTARGLTPEARSVVPTAAAATEEFGRWLAEDDHPKAFVGSNGQIVLGMARAARAAGLALPDDVLLAGFDNEIWTEMIGGGMSVVEQPVEELGRSAMDLLFRRLDRPDVAPCKIMLSARLVTRAAAG
jgi:LacI family fructose operon transcriptional repressor